MFTLGGAEGANNQTNKSGPLTDHTCLIHTSRCLDCVVGLLSVLVPSPLFSVQTSQLCPALLCVEVWYLSSWGFQFSDCSHALFRDLTVLVFSNHSRKQTFKQRFDFQLPSPLVKLERSQCSSFFSSPTLNFFIKSDESAYFY